MNDVPDPNRLVGFNDFLNPNSMITPGAAGGITMIITNALCGQFNALPGNWTALAVSFLLGSVTLVYAASLPKRILYLVINSLIIFVMAHGANSIGQQATNPPPETGAQHASFIGHKPARWLVLTSLEGGAGPNADQAMRSPQGHRRMQLAQATKKKEKENKSGFFKSWSWGS